MVFPFRITIILAYIGLLSGLLMLVSPQKLNLMEHEIKMFQWENVFQYQSKPIENTEAKSILALEEQMKQVDAKLEAQNTSPLNSYSSVGRITENLLSDTSSIRGKKPIEYPEDNQTALYPFFESLANLTEESHLIRVLHYGDSQLEGDRITEYLRNRLQNRFGGCGVGWIPIVELENSRSTLSQKSSPQWKKYAIYGQDKNHSSHKKYGLLGSYFTFTEKDTSQFTVAYLKISSTKNTYKRTTQAEVIKCYYTTHEIDSLRLILKWNDSIWTDTFLPSAVEYDIFSQPLPQPYFENILVEFQGKGKPEIYGISLDCKQGIAVDNIAMRGSSGTDFVQISRSAISRIYAQNHVKLIIWQFGVNVVPYLIENFEFYEKSVSAQLRHIKAAFPDVAILVVGVSDMSRKEDGEVLSYPNLPYVRDAQKRAAFANGCAFWDLYEAMGGKNSIIQWAHHKPALASRDFIHFTREGARFTGEMLYNELMTEYSKFLAQRTTQNK